MAFLHFSVFFHVTQKSVRLASNRANISLLLRRIQLSDVLDMIATQYIKLRLHIRLAFDEPDD